MAEVKKEQTIKPRDVQKLLSDPRYRIELHNLVHQETERAYKSVEGLSVQTQDIEGVAKKAISDFEEATKNLRTIIAYGCYFGTKDQAYLWNGALNRLATEPQVAGSTFLLTLQLYPSLLAMYAGGLSALSASNLGNLKSIFKVQSTSSARDPRELVLEANCTMLGNAGNQLLGYERRKTPLSDHLFELFDESLPKELSFGQDFALLFDKWEILIGMVVADIYRGRGRNTGLGGWAPVGRFSWRGEYSDGASLKVVRKELELEKSNWGPLKAGLFDGSEARAKEALSVVEQVAAKVGFF
ncbi:MAG TPA: hypothetical protein VHD84_01885 [Candidatus Saccharimonadales bacterium]|nr:hypothetical protein [Candidatus Saccharimonadales bacterium]